MARVLDALNRAEMTLVRPVVVHASAPASEAPPRSPAIVAREEEVPYIEVGGPGSPSEASSRVLACGPLPLPRFQRVAVPPSGVEPDGGPSAPSALAPVEVEFRSLMWKESDFSADLITFHQPDHSVSQQYRALLEGLRATLKGRPPHLLLLSAGGPTIGATTALLNLAITAARGGELRVAVVDANLARPGVAGRLGLTETPGLRELLAGSVALEETLRETDQERLWALTAGEVAGAETTTLSPEELASLLRALRERFDLVLVDGPVWRDSREIRALAAACDAVYLLLPQREADQAGVKDLLRAIRRRTRRLSGMILTQH